MAPKKPDLSTRSGAARHSAERDRALDAAVCAFHEAVRMYTGLTAQANLNKVRPAIVEEYRFGALAAFEALLDNMKTASDALVILNAVRGASPPDKPKRTEL
ncbi:hypothetical protein Ccr2_gp321 [Caulobacter phage Ccr2]|uniref:Uncharacterized protein n=5 Tax=Viruses TaxID=10239 RepID=J3U9A3_9CAUD|nr:hypothetical protein D865_gp102 [Caulobacter phage phiCbK]ARB13852.1 hypothetical protein Ccr10_gp322 [Caulobacter phage Ccr10]ARB14197.1 hypothetical protein Ccr2_gp321 [Caulobacter phage Ccr2]ARB14891.1 hypothetical protein Ccr29_gp335 [Caulobacter phage Ccr29]ARB15229.1 hypothetical protein Ccr32_gp311 [Caulobacter phage Ccr32]ARB15563.1 hypothetical protein Ccr34_gp321 [Caulobacter phage Ccr34]